LLRFILFAQFNVQSRLSLFQAVRRVVRLATVTAVSWLLNDQHPGMTRRRQGELENFPRMWCAKREWRSSGANLVSQ